MSYNTHLCFERDFLSSEPSNIKSAQRTNNHRDNLFALCARQTQLWLMTQCEHLEILMLIFKRTIS